MRPALLLLALVIAGCTTEPPCLLVSGVAGRTITEAEYQTRVPDGGRVLSGSVECEYGWCVRDSTVPAREPAAAALGYCTRPCDPDGACPDGLSCELHVVGPSEAVGVCVR